MKYPNIQKASFINRPNRFIAVVEIDGHKETVHVKNTGRCRELLVPGCEVWLTAPGNPDRKTKYDLVAVRKSNGILFNIDSQAPNKVVKEWLEKKDYSFVKPEFTYGDSRIDFYMEKSKLNSRIDFYMEKSKLNSGIDLYIEKSKLNSMVDGHSENGKTGDRKAKDGLIVNGQACDGQTGNEQISDEQIIVSSTSLEPERFLMEVKGCTLEIDGIGYFPDAPTERGVKHIRELIKAKKEGYNAAIAFVIQMEGVREVLPNIEMHPEFGTAMEDAKKAGVKIIYYMCRVEPDELEITGMEIR